MKLELSKAVCLWLRELGIIHDPIQEESQEHASVSFDEQIYFENGWLMGRILKHIERDYKIGLRHLGRIRKITVLKEHENWQIIWRALRKIQIRVPDNCDQIVVSEHNEIIGALLQQIYSRFYERPPRLKVPYQRTSFTVESYQSDKELDDAVSSLELVCLAIGRAFSMNITDILTLLVSGQSGLAHIIVQGSNVTDFQQVLDLYELLSEHSETLRQLMERDRQHLWVMNGLRCGLFSNSVQVASKCVRLMKQLAVGEWLTQTDNMKSVLLGLKRHPELSRSLFDLMVGALGEGFVPYLKNDFQARFNNEAQFLLVAAEILKYIKFSLYKKEFLESLIVDDWLLFALDCLQADKAGQARMRAFNLLTEALMLHDFTRNLRFGAQIRRAFSAEEIRNETLCNSLHFCSCVIRLLCFHAERKNPQARRYYELLCKVLQTTRNEEVREFIMRNLQQLFSRFPRMPLEVFLQAVTQINFMQSHELALVQNLSSQSGLQAIDAEGIGQLALSNYKKSIANFQYSGVVVSIVQQFKMKVAEFVYATIRELLDTYRQLLEKPAAASKRIESLAKRAQSKKLASIFYTHGEDNELIHEKKKSNTISFIKRLIGASNKNMVKCLKPWVVGCKRDLEKKKLKHPGLHGCLKLIEQMLLAPDELEFSKEPTTIEEEPQLSESVFTQSHHLPEPPKKNTLLAEEDEDRNEFLQPITPMGSSHLQYSTVFKASDSRLQQANSEIMSEQEEIEVSSRSQNKSELVVSGLFKKPSAPLIGFSEESQQTQAWKMFTDDLLENHELLYLRNTKQRYQKLFTMLFEEFNKKGLDQFIRHYNLTALLLGDTFRLLLKELTRQSEGVLTQDIFNEFCVQIAYNSFPGTAKMVEADCLERLVGHLEQQRRRHGQSTMLFEDIDKVFHAKSEKVRELTNQLRRDSSTVLPSDYRSLIVRTASYANTLAASKLRIKDSVAIAYEVFSELLQSVIGSSSIIQPILIVENKLVVRPNVHISLQQQSPTKEEETVKLTDSVVRPPRNKLRSIIDATKLDVSLMASPKGELVDNSRVRGLSAANKNMGGSPNTHATNSPVSMLQPSLKLSLVELNRKRVEKLANRRKILEKDMKALDRTPIVDNVSLQKELIDMPTQVTESNLQEKTEPAEPTVPTSEAAF